MVEEIAAAITWSELTHCWARRWIRDGSMTSPPRCATITWTRAPGKRSHDPRPLTLVNAGDEVFDRTAQIYQLAGAGRS